MMPKNDNYSDLFNSYSSKNINQFMAEFDLLVGMLNQKNKHYVVEKVVGIMWILRLMLRY